jgi:photosystem II stability/assembly factor-like uncharacterized protein
MNLLRLKWIIMVTVLLVGSPSVHAEMKSSLQPFDWKKAYFFNFYDVCPLPNGDVWVVGSKGIICAFDAASNKWVIQESNFARNLYSVSFPSPEQGWVVGQNGTILSTRNRGITWEMQKSETTEHLFSVSFADSQNGWAVGTYGAILHTSNGGKLWEKQGDQVDRIHNGVFFTDAQYGWIVGEFGVILHTRDGGVSWGQQENPCGEKTLFSVYFKDHSTGYATGMDGILLYTDNGGTTWTQIDSHIKENLFSVTAQGNRQWCVGLKGTFSAQVGGVWKNETENIPTRAWLKKCAFVDEKSGWIVGSVGTVLHTVDGGMSWVPAGQTKVK